MIQLYRPGASPMHRLSAGSKLLLLAVVAFAVSLYPHDAVSIGAVALGVGLLFIVARVPLRVLGTELWRLRWLVLVLGGALWIFVSPLTAWVSTARVVSLVLLATLLTMTTPMGELLAVLHRLLAPLRRWGVDADAVAMTLSLALTLIPVFSGFAAEIADAHRARGVRIGARAIVPLLVRTLRHADDVGDALVARGLV
ncbi:energy-coupling factor transporter transmembrane protein EcfT [Microbacterium sp. 3J1]|uniref:energy-coupling factor transporter transmembrane component T family protein n=1 Tax=Microbacterium sp. 3J1 TaxID=861269 RepID=UPI000B813AB2|nr:energy-coupling factor transporter transmembrane protein EcfT [Microbacterium sp. 3J1]